MHFENTFMRITFERMLIGRWKHVSALLQLLSLFEIFVNSVYRLRKLVQRIFGYSNSEYNICLAIWKMYEALLPRYKIYCKVKKKWKTKQQLCRQSTTNKLVNLFGAVDFVPYKAKNYYNNYMLKNTKINIDVVKVPYVAHT